MTPTRFQPRDRATGGEDVRAHSAMRGVTDVESDIALMIRISRGDQPALARLYQCHAPAMYRLASRICRPDQAEEILQEVFLRLWERPDRFDPDRGSARSFLLSCTHSRAVDLLRRDTARRSREQGDSARSSIVAPDVDSLASLGLLRDDIASALLALPTCERRAVALAYFGGHSYREVAALLEEPEGTIKSRIRAGLSRLRADLQGWKPSPAAPDAFSL